MHLHAMKRPFGLSSKAFRCLAVACIQQNSLLLDPQTKSKELTEIAAIGLSRDVVASDGGLGVMRRLRELLEISGHDKNHPHAQLQPDQDEKRALGFKEL